MDILVYLSSSILLTTYAIISQSGLWQKINYFGIRKTSPANRVWRWLFLNKYRAKRVAIQTLHNILWKSLVIRHLDIVIKSSNLYLSGCVKRTLNKFLGWETKRTLPTKYRYHVWCRLFSSKLIIHFYMNV